MAIKLLKFKESEKKQITENYNIVKMLSDKDSKNMEISIWTSKNQYQELETKNETAYFVLQGEMIVDENIIAKVWDVVFVPSNTKYTLNGIFKAVIVNNI